MRLTAFSISSVGALLASTASFADSPAPVEISDASAAAMVSQSLALGGSFGNGAYAITPSWSEELGVSITGAVGTELEESSAIGLIVTTGERKREALINFGLTIDESRQIILSAGQLQEKLEFGTSGEQEWVKQNEFGLAYDARNYSFNAYHVDSETTANFSGSKATGLEMAGSVEVSSVTTLDYTAGYQNLEWDDGSADDAGLTASIDFAHQLDADTVLNVSAAHSVSANTYGIGATWNFGDATLSASYKYLDTLVGSGADDRSVSLTFNVPFGSTRTSLGHAVVSSSGAASQMPNLLAEVMKRPTFLPTRVTTKGSSDSCLPAPQNLELLAIGSTIQNYSVFTPSSDSVTGSFEIYFYSNTDITTYPVSIVYDGNEIVLEYTWRDNSNPYYKFEAEHDFNTTEQEVDIRFNVGCSSGTGRIALSD